MECKHVGIRVKWETTRPQSVGSEAAEVTYLLSFVVENPQMCLRLHLYPSSNLVDPLTVSQSAPGNSQSISRRLVVSFLQAFLLAIATWCSPAWRSERNSPVCTWWTSFPWKDLEKETKRVSLFQFPNFFFWKWFLIFLCCFWGVNFAEAWQTCAPVNTWPGRSCLIRHV